MAYFFNALLVIATLLLVWPSFEASQQQKFQILNSTHNFYIDFEHDTFVKDSRPFRYVSGGLHPYRIPKELWQDRLVKMWASGVNALQTYVFWNEHEPFPGVYDFEGQNNIFEFYELAQKIGFVIIMRPGPFVCAEHEMGGLPWWLLANGTRTVRPRSSEKTYFDAVRRWFDVLLPRLQPFLYANDGPIVTVQIENEYGAYYTCEETYKTDLRDLVIRHLGNDTVYFTTDPYQKIALQCGKVPGVYSTVDFGAWVVPDQPFAMQRLFEPKGPLVNSEFYIGWIDIWGGPHQRVDTSSMIRSFERMMNMNANVNFYMFHGGTNWGFSSGAVPPYLPQPTSYDYDAPLSEAGDVTAKFMALRESIGKYLEVPDVDVPANSSKIAYGNIEMTYHVPLVEAILELSSQRYDSFEPMSFERLGQAYGFVMYNTTLDNPEVYRKVLSIEGIRDRAYVQIGQQSAGTLYRLSPMQKLQIQVKNNTDRNLYIIVENMGRINFGNNLLDSKGILSNVTLGGVQLNNWSAHLTSSFIPNYRNSTRSGDFVSHFMTNDRLLTQEKIRSTNFDLPAIYIGNFTASANGEDTFLTTNKFTKGLAFVRSKETLSNLGRYWPEFGPSTTLYTPGVFLTPSADNQIALIEFEGSVCASDICQVESVEKPNFKD